MKLPKGTTVYHLNKVYVGEVPDEIAEKLGLKEAPKPKKLKEKKD